jgi:hypothetical protein
LECDVLVALFFKRTAILARNTAASQHFSDDPNEFLFVSSTLLSDGKGDEQEDARKVLGKAR